MYINIQFQELYKGIQLCDLWNIKWKNNGTCCIFLAWFISPVVVWVDYMWNEWMPLASNMCLYDICVLVHVSLRHMSSGTSYYIHIYIYTCWCRLYHVYTCTCGWGYGTRTFWSIWHPNAWHAKPGLCQMRHRDTPKKECSVTQWLWGLIRHTLNHKGCKGNIC